MRRLLSVSLLALTALACDRPPTGPRDDPGPQTAISDGANLGNTHFYFLPPVLKMPSFSGAFDGTLAPAVSICEWDLLGNKCGPVVAEFGSGGSGDGAVAKDVMGEKYHVNWQTDQCLRGPCSLDPAKIYRIRVFVGSAQLGFADVDVVSNGSQLKNVQTNEFIGLVNGRTLPIKFRIEVGAVGVFPAGGSVAVGASGGTVTTADGSVALAIPEGALPATKNISVTMVTDVLPGTGAWAPVVDLGPDGTAFAVPVTLAIEYQPESLPEGVPPSALVLMTFDGTGWVQVPGSTIDQVDNTVSAPISHFSTYSVGIWPNYVNGVAQTTIRVGQTTAVNGSVWSYSVVPYTYCYWIRTGWFSRRYVCTTYSNAYYYSVPGIAVYWNSSAPSIASVPAGPTYTNATGTTMSPPVTGRLPGVTDLRAFAAGTASGPMPLTILGVLGLLPRTASNVAGWNVRQNITQSVALPTDLAVSLRNVNGFLVINEGGTANYTYGGQTGSYTILAGQTQKLLGAAGLNGVGVDTLIASAAGFVPDTAIITLVKGKFLVSGWPATLQVGDSAALQVTLTDQNGALGGLASPITLALAGTPGLVFSNGNAAITTIGVQQRTSSAFYVKVISTGSHDISVTHRDYLTYTNTLSATPAGQLDFQPKTATIVAGWSVSQRIGVTPVPPANVAFSVTNLNGFLVLWESGGSTYTYGGQTSSFVMPAGSTSKLFGINGTNGPGVDTLIATAPSLLPDTAIITIVKGRIRIDGWPASLRVGDSAAVQLTLVDASGALGNSSPVDFAMAASSGLAFSDGQATLASIHVPQRSSATFYVKAIAAGTGSVTFTHPWYITSPYTVAIAPAFVSIGVSPDPAGVIPGGTVQLTGTPRNAAGNPVSGIGLTWSSANTAVATVDANGLVTGVVSGTVSITASSGGINGSATVRVGTPSISPSPGSLSLPVQQGQTAQAQINFVNGGSGLLAGLSAGSFSNYFNGSAAPWVTASWNTTTAPATLTITAAPGLNIGAGVHQLRFDVSAPGASNSPYTFYSINITVIAAGVPPVNATIVPNPTSLSFSVPQGESASRQISITNTGSDPLTNLTAGSFSNYFNGSPAPWVTASFNTTTAPAILTITAAPGTTIPIGTHQLRFDVASPGATNSPFTFYSINVTVEPGLVISQFDLGALGANSSLAVTLNEVGRIVGASGSAAVYWPSLGGAITTIPNPYGDLNYAEDINEAGIIAGHTPYIGWLFDPAAGTFRNPPGPFTQNNRTFAIGINDVGQVLACADNGSFAQNYVWTLAGNVTTLIPNAYNVCSGRLNDGGMAITSASPGAGGAARYWNQNTQSVVTLPSLGGVTVGFDLNASGIVVGSSQIAGQPRAFRWDPTTGQMLDLGTLGGTQAEAMGINDAGWIVGWSLTAAGEKHAFLRNPVSGRMYDLGVLPGYPESLARDVNNALDIVGWSIAGSATRATRWKAQ